MKNEVDFHDQLVAVNGELVNLEREDRIRKIMVDFRCGRKEAEKLAWFQENEKERWDALVDVLKNVAAMRAGCDKHCVVVPKIDLGVRPSWVDRNIKPVVEEEQKEERLSAINEVCRMIKENVSVKKVSIPMGGKARR